MTNVYLFMVHPQTDRTTVHNKTKDTIEMTPSLLYNFTRPFGKFDVALVFE